MTNKALNLSTSLETKRLVIIMKKHFLNLHSYCRHLQPQGFASKAASFRGLILSFSFLFLSMVWVQNVFATPVTLSGGSTTWSPGGVCRQTKVDFLLRSVSN